MLFDLRGRGRRRTIQVIYLFLAVLIGGGLVFFGVGGTADPDPYGVWHSSQTGLKGANLSSWDEPRIDKLLEDARAAAQPRRRELYADFQEQFAQQLPSLPLYTTTQLYLQPTALQGVRMNLISNPGARFWQVQEWYLKSK